MAVGAMVGRIATGDGWLPQDMDAMATDTTKTTETVASIKIRIRIRRITGADAERNAIGGTPLQLGIAATCHSRLNPVCADKGARKSTLSWQ